MKIVIRTLALTLVLSSLAAGALTKRNVSGVQVVPADVPMPTCPLGQGDCGISKF